MEMGSEFELRSWRLAQGMTLAAAAAHFGIAGVNPAETYRRYEIGLVWPSAEMLDRIARLTGGAVPVGAMVATRLRSRTSGEITDPEEKAA